MTDDQLYKALQKIYERVQVAEHHAAKASAYAHYAMHSADLLVNAAERRGEDMSFNDDDLTNQLDRDVENILVFSLDDTEYRL
jgi:hypothetical protein